jgi:hypothetical protein
MIALTVLAGLLRALSTLAQDPKLGGDTVSRVLGLAAFAVERGEAGRAALEQLCAEIDVMVAQGRPPTEIEWAVLRTRSDMAHAAIVKAAGPAPVDPAPVDPAPVIEPPVVEPPAAEGDSQG